MYSTYVLGNLLLFLRNYEEITLTILVPTVYQVHLVSEHVWCDDYLVRSLYLKNTQTNETR